MRFLERGDEPNLFATADVEAFRAASRTFHDDGGTRTTQERTGGVEQFGSLVGDALVEALVTDVGPLCAYSEVLIPDVGFGNAVVHRPGRNASDADGRIHPDHYWWLVAEWDNWLLASDLVRESKGQFFPVVGDRMAVGRTAPLDVGVLLDPTADRPEWYLRFAADGTVRSCQPPSPSVDNRHGGIDRGAATIQACGLNSASLVDARRRVAPRQVARLGADDVPIGDGRTEHVGFRRQLLAQSVLRALQKRQPWTREGDPPPWHALLPEITATLATAPDTWAAAARNGRDHLREPVIDHVEQVFPDVAPLLADLFAGRPVVPGRPRRVINFATPPVLETVTIRNFKAIEKATFTVNPGTTLSAGSAVADDLTVGGAKAFLGENGSGKSSILQAVAFALAGDQLEATMTALRVSWGQFLRRPRPGEDPPTHGRVAVTFRDQSVIDLRFNHNTHWFLPPRADQSVPPQNFFVRGYGATRSLPRLPDDPGDDDPRRPVRIANLFDPRHTVVDAEEWLLALDDPTFNLVAAQVSELIQHRRTWETGEPAPPLLSITPDRARVLVHDQPLREVSDGYRAVVALVCDIMAGAASTDLSDMREANGIVLIDEIGAHLHPSWRMFITSLLRRVFPGMQFLVSTHEPLCLRGLFEGEVVLVQRDGDGAVVLEEIDRSPSDFRVDQLLTSEFFGLSTTIDPDEDRRLQEYYRLLSLPIEEQGPDHAAALARVRPTSSRALGYTRRDQLAYAAIDRYLSQRRDMGVEQRRRRRVEALQGIVDIWNQVGAVDPGRRP